MKFNKIVLLFFLSSLMTFELFSQSENLRINFLHDFNFELQFIQLTVVNETDTIYSQKLPNSTEIFVDSLTTGKYSINLMYGGVDNDENIQSITKYIQIKPNQITEIFFDLSLYVNYTELDTNTSINNVKLRREGQFKCSYFDHEWNPDGNNPKFNFGIGYSGYEWHSFSKHFGFLLGGGIEYTIAPLRVNSNLHSTEKIKSSRYKYFNGQFDVKFRVSSLNQQSDFIQGHSIFFDIGALYNFPLYFRKITFFENRDKLINRFIHQYNDARVYVNLGLTNVQFFVSYRPFDFVKQNFQEMPRYNAGIKLNING